MYSRILGCNVHALEYFDTSLYVSNFVAIESILQTTV